MSSYVRFGSTRRFFPGKKIFRKKKAWGEEQWIVNKEYCGKKLLLRKNHRCSMHSHAKKDEVFYLQSGKVLLEMDGERYTLHPGDFVHVQTGLPHRFTGLEDSEILEFSTTHDEEDSHRTELSGHVEQERYMRQQDIIGRYKEARLLVVGDVMLDTYVIGTVDRISPEAPIPVVVHRSERAVAGGAANAAMNAAALGARVTLVGVCGKDAAGTQLESLLKKGKVRSSLLADSRRSTTRKNRILAESGQQIVRLDYEESTSLPAALHRRLLDRVRKLLPTHQALLLSDYAKGVFAPETLAACIRMAHDAGVPVIVDPKPLDSSYLESVRGATILTPNRREAQILLGGPKKDTAARLAKAVQGAVLLTLGAEGMVLRRGDRETAFPALAREVADVSGAGDTVAAVLALTLAAGGTMEDGADLANRAASVVVSKQGTATLTDRELLSVL